MRFTNHDSITAISIDENHDSCVMETLYYFNILYFLILKYIIGVFGITETLRETCFKHSAWECDVTQPEVVVYGIRKLV